jgi:hypothetical protein
VRNPECISARPQGRLFGRAVQTGDSKKSLRFFSFGRGSTARGYQKKSNRPHVWHSSYQSGYFSARQIAIDFTAEAYPGWRDDENIGLVSAVIAIAAPEEATVSGQGRHLYGLLTCKSGDDL